MSNGLQYGLAASICRNSSLGQRILGDVTSPFGGNGRLIAGTYAIRWIATTGDRVGTVIEQSDVINPSIRASE